MSEGVTDVRRNTSPAIDVRNVISNIDAANIRKNAETAIRKDAKNASVNENSAEFMQAWHRSTAVFDHLV